jgi:hypothetical protein
VSTHNISLSVAQALLRSATESGGTATLTRKAHTPFSVAVSREVGAHGEAVAAAVGRRLGWAVYDHALVDKIAEDIRKPAFHVDTLDEKPTSWLEDCLTALSSGYPVTAEQYFKYLLGAVRGLGEVGHCVILGRGASFILPPENTLRVRIVGDLPDRVRAVARERNLGEKEAREWIARTEAEHHRFVREHFGKDESDPEEYDLTLNTSRLSVEECAEFIVAALKRMEQHEAAER